MQSPPSTTSRGFRPRVVAPEQSDPVVAPGELDRQARPALFAFVAILVVAVPALLVLGRWRWFQYDEWDFLASRDGTNLHDLFEPHAVHWSTIPILVYRSLWYVFGIRSYVPYQLLAVLSHLAVAVLVRVVMRRAGVRPWTATTVAALLVFFGAGEENILWAFQIGFTLALAFGLVQLLLADHDGPVDRRDWLGLLAGLLALLCSGIAVMMVIVVGIAMLLRRGWRVAALHTAPLGAVYAVWYFAIGRSAYDDQADQAARDTVDFVRTAFATAYGGIGQVPGVGWVVAAILIGGLSVAWRSLPAATLRRVAAAPAALLAGSVIFVVITAVGRATDEIGIASATRFAYIVAALTLPAIAVAVDAIMRQWRFTVPVLAVLLVCALVGNVQDFREDADAGRAFRNAYREAFLSRARSPLAKQIPGDLHPDLLLAPRVTYGWMRDGVASGRIPAPGPISPTFRAMYETGLVLAREPGHRPRHCVTRSAPATVQLAAGGSIGSPGTLRIVYTDSAGVAGWPVLVPPSRSPYLVAYAGPITVHVEALDGDGSYEVCDLAGAPITPPTGP